MIGTDKLKVNHISAIRGTTLLKNQYPKQAKSIAYAPQPAPNCRRSVKADTVGRMTITDKADFKAKVRASMRQLQNDPEKIRSFYTPFTS